MGRAAFAGLLVIGLAAAVHAETAEETQIGLANGCFQRGYYDMAAEAYEEYLAEFPEGAHVNDALLRLGECQYAENNLEKALDSFNKLLERGVQGTERQRALLRKGELLYRLGRLEEALPLLTELAVPGSGAEVRAGALYYKGLAHYSAGDMTAAEEAFSTLINDLPNDALVPYARYRLGFVYLGKGQDEKAAVAFTEVADSQADDALRMDSRFRAAETYDKLGWYDAAVAAYAKLLEAFPGSQYEEEAALGKVWALYHAGKFEQAYQAASAYRAAHPQGETVPGMTYLQANCLQQQKKYDEALALYRQVRENHPDSGFAGRCLYKTAWTLYLSGRNEEAKQAIRTFLDEYGGADMAGDAAFLRGTILVSEGNFGDALEEFRLVAESKKYAGSEFVAEAHYKVGECLTKLGQPDEAARVFRSFAQKYPENPLAKQALLQVADAKLSTDSFEEAIAEYRKSLESEPNPAIRRDILHRIAITYHNMGINLERSEKPEEAAEKFKASADTFEQILKEFPGSSYTAEANLRIGDYYLSEAEDPLKSVEYHQAAYDVDPDGPYAGRALKGVALARFKAKDYDTACQLFLRLMKNHPDVSLNEKAYAWTGERLFEQEKWDDAAAAFQALLDGIEDYPSPEKVMFRIAECRKKAGDAGKAIAMFEQVIETAPRSSVGVESKYQIAQLLETQEKFDEAMALYAEAADSSTGDTAARARFRLGELLEAREEYADAAKNYMIVAILLMHEDLSPEALWRAGQCHEKAGKTAQAKKVYTDVLAEYPDTKQAEKAQERLAKLN